MTQIHKLGKPFTACRIHDDLLARYNKVLAENTNATYTAGEVDYFSHWLALPDPSNDHIKDI